MPKGLRGAANPQWKGVKDRIIALALQGVRRKQIAEQLNCSYRYTGSVLNEAGVALGRPFEADNHAWRGGRRVDLDGYVLLQAKPRILEHRTLLEQALGRLLAATEVVDHIDGITIHNALPNLRLFATNGDHLRATRYGLAPEISVSGWRNIQERFVRPAPVPVDTCYLRRERGDVRLRSILRAALELGKAHPCLSGTRHWLEQAGIDPFSDRSLQRGWDDLVRRYEQDLAR